MPDPVYDPFGGDLATRRVVEGLKRGDWREADELLARTRKGDDRAAKAGHIAGAALGWPCRGDSPGRKGHWVVGNICATPALLEGFADFYPSLVVDIGR